jgi:hypothetical protein
MSLIEILKARWYVFIAILAILIFLLNWFGVITIIGKESFSTLSLYESNEGFIPQGHTITLTEEDFKEFPQLASIIRDKTTKPTVINKKGVRSYDVPFSSNEYSRFISRYWSNSSRSDDKSWPPRRIFEYNENYYEYDYPVIH